MRSAGSITHLFSHIRLVMHVHELRVPEAPAKPNGERRKWYAEEEVEKQSISTGNARCWALAQGKTSKKGKEK
jgi:A/G-specific adenine glycosylase